MTQATRLNFLSKRFSSLSHQIWFFPTLGLIGVIVLAFFTIAALHLAFANSVWIDEPIHAALEAAGGVLALALAPLIFVQKDRFEEKGKCIWVCSSLIAMGLLDLSLAFLPVGESLFLIRSFGNFFCGLLISLIWLPRLSLTPGQYEKVPIYIALLMGFLGMLFHLLPDSTLLSLASRRTLDLASAMMNELGVLGYLAAGVFFSIQLQKRQGRANRFFAGFAFLMALAGILFAFGETWTAPWWLFHYLRFLAFLAVVYHVTITFRKALHSALRTNLSLEQEVRNRTQQLLNLNQKLQKEVQDRLSSEAKLKENAAHLARLADSMPQIIWTADHEGKTLYLNLKWFQYTGQAVGSDPSETDWLASVHPGDWGWANQKWRHCVRTGQDFEVELRLKRHDGQYRWHLIRAVLLDAGGSDEKINWFATGTDIHDQKELLERIRESEEHFNIATTAAEIGTWNVDFKSLRIRSSPINNQIMGLDPGTEIYDFHQFREKVLPEDLETIEEKLRDALNHKREFSVEYRIQRGQEIRWLYAKGRATYGKSEEPLRLYGVNIDLTHQKEIEEKLKAALDKANESNRLKSSFLANMSHEIRTPLGAILGFTDLLREDNLTREEKNHFFEVITRNGEQLSALINDILDLSKVESGQFKVEILKCDVRRTLQEVVALHEITAQQKDLQLSFLIEENVPDWIGSDPTRLKQILTNVVGNSVKFTQKGFVHIHVLMDTKNQLRIQVQDSGIGLTEEQKGKLFQAFSQADPSTTRQFGGTGLGLVLSRKLARALGGDLVILSSKPEIGSIFEIRVPNQHLSSNSEKTFRETPGNRSPHHDLSH